MVFFFVCLENVVCTRLCMYNKSEGFTQYKKVECGVFDVLVFSI